MDALRKRGPDDFATKAQQSDDAEEAQHDDRDIPKEIRYVPAGHGSLRCDALRAEAQIREQGKTKHDRQDDADVVKQFGR